MAILCVLSFLTYYDRVCIMRAQEDIQRDLSISDAQMGWVFSAFFLAYALFEIPGGWMGDRWGSHVTLTRIVLAWSLFTCLTGSATGLIGLLTWRFLFGVGEAGAYPNMARVQGRWLPLRVRAFWGGVLWLMARWGGAFAPLIFGSMIRAFNSIWFRETFAAVPRLGSAASWRLGFWAAGMIGLVWCGLFYFWFRDDPAEKRSVNEAELLLIRDGSAHHEDASQHAPGMWKSLLRSRSLWAIAIYYICGSIAWSFFITWMPRYLKAEHGIDYKGSELMAAMPLICGGVACLVGGFLSDLFVQVSGRRRLGRALFPICGALTAACAMAAIPHMQTAKQAVALMCLAAAAFDFGQASNWASIVDIGGRHTGVATGFINMLGNLGGSISPPLGEAIFNHFGWQLLFMVYAGFFIAAGCMWLIIDPTRRFYEERRL